MIKKIVHPTYIAEATRLQGEIQFYCESQILGLVEGNIRQQSFEVLQVGTTGWVTGNIFAQGVIVIQGRVDGDITSKRKVVLTHSARVKGKITSPSVQIVPGAHLEGAISMEVQQATGRVQVAA